MSGSQHEHVSEWDGAYVLGALSPADLHLFEQHLEECARCREAVAELAPMPGLLAQIRPDRLESSAEETTERAPVEPRGATEPMTPTEPSEPSRSPDLPEPPTAGQPGPTETPRPLEPAAASTRSRRRCRLLAGALAAAAAVVLAITLPLALRDRASGPEVTVSPSAPSGESVPMRVDVALTPASWGTALTITCDYPQAIAGPGGGYGPGGPPSSYALVVTAEDGTRSQVSSWQGVPGEMVTLEAGTAVDLAEITTVEVVDAAGAPVLAAKVEDSSSSG